MSLSIHFVVDNCPPERLNRGLLYMKRTKQRSCDIAAGAQLDRGMQFVERVRAEMPTIEILWRNLDPDDTGAHTKMSAPENYQRKVSKHLAWFQRNKVVYMPDNESGGSDEHIKTKYVPWQVEHLVMLHADKLRGAVLRSSTGTFPENQYTLFKPVFNAMLPGDYISPNEYSAQPGYAKGSGGHIARYENFWIAAGRKLPTIIGEAGVAMDYDPGKGYINAGMSDQAYAQQMLDEEVWYENGQIDRHLYLLGGFSHDGYRLRDGVFEYLENYYEKHPIVITTTPIPPPAPPPPPPTPTDAIVPSDLGVTVNVTITGDNWFMRALPSADGATIGLLTEGEHVQLFPATASLADGQSYKVVKRITPVAGEANIGWSAYPTPPITMPPPPVDMDSIARLSVIRAKVHAMSTMLEDVVSDIRQLEADLLAKKAA